MPIKTVHLLALLLLLTSVVGTAPTLVAAQGSGSFSEFDGSGIRFERLEGRETDWGDGNSLEEYFFFFDRWAYIPQAQYPEVMVVQVQSGRFAFRVGSEDVVIVDPGGREIPILEPTEDPIVVSDPELSSDVVRTQAGEPCTDLCALRPGETVLIQRGATVFLPGGVTCFWCNVMADESVLLVVPAILKGDEPFSWTQFHDINQEATPQSAVHPQGFIASGAAVGCR